MLGYGNNTVTAAGYTNKITTRHGDDTIVAGDGNATVSSGAGDDTITLAGWSNLLDAGAGHNTVTIWNGGNDTFILHGGGTDDISGYTLGSGDVFDLRQVLPEANASLQFDSTGNWAGSGIAAGFAHVQVSAEIGEAGPQVNTVEHGQRGWEQRYQPHGFDQP